MPEGQSTALGTDSAILLLIAQQQSRITELEQDNRNLRAELHNAISTYHALRNTMGDGEDSGSGDSGGGGRHVN